MCDLIYPTWANPIHGKIAGIYWWAIIIIGVFILTPFVIGAFRDGNASLSFNFNLLLILCHVCLAYDHKKEKLEERERTLLRVGIISAFYLIDVDESGELSQAEFAVLHMLSCSLTDLNYLCFCRRSWPRQRI